MKRLPAKLIAYTQNREERMNKKDRYLNSLPPQWEAGGRERSERGRNWSDVTRARREDRRKGGLNQHLLDRRPGY
ncbi:hypothetical protein TNCV_4802371 [Trichonephila clavipes]|nr:hypothetical protein TNCV_4802371 [Trichonephila clavipes]